MEEEILRCTTVGALLARLISILLLLFVRTLSIFAIIEAHPSAIVSRRREATGTSSVHAGVRREMMHVIRILVRNRRMFVVVALIGGYVGASERIMSPLESPARRSFHVFFRAVHGLFSVMKISLVASLIQREIMANEIAVFLGHQVRGRSP
jgi:hypothetical protein